MLNLIPHLWYDKEAAEAVALYTSLIPNSKINFTGSIEGTPSGTAGVIDFQLAGKQFMAISAGPYFSHNESTSLMLHCKDKAELEGIYNGLVEGGSVLMELAEYPFNPYYAWIKDKYGLSWQLMLARDCVEDNKIEVCLLFGGTLCGRAEEAIDYYATVLPGAQKGFVNLYGVGEADPRAKINYGELLVNGEKLIFMDHGFGGDAPFTEALSLMLISRDQAEVNRYTEALSAVPEAQMCGWVKDKFGFSWQIVPEVLQRAYSVATTEQMAAIHQAILKMNVLDVEVLEGILAGK